MFIALLVSFLSDALLLVLVRFTVRNVSAKTSVSRIVLAVLVQVGVIVLLVVAPYEVLYLSAGGSLRPATQSALVGTRQAVLCARSTSGHP